MVKQNKSDCAELMEQTNELINAIILVYIKSDTGAELSPSVLMEISKFTETLHKIHAFVEAQQSGSKVKMLFRQGEMTTLLKDCKAGLQQGLDFFHIKTYSVVSDIKELQENARRQQDEVLGLIETFSDTASAEMGIFYAGSYTSSTSISMLPSEPKIFHGREAELSELLGLFQQGTPRIAILGAGGMGKTSLAKAVLHHSEITARYGQHRLFVTADSVTNAVELAAQIGAHVGLKPAADLTQPVIQHLSAGPPCLLILDNLETVWEPSEFRKELENFLSLVTQVVHVAVVITMRGAERPSNVAWTRPFLPPLKPLSQIAAQQVFLDITDGGYEIEEVNSVLNLTDNMPLAINLLAHLVETESCSTVLSRWEHERTSLISDGYDRRSNLDLSISVSLSSPRLKSSPHALDLLSLLSILPDGLSDAELLQSNLPLNGILGCKNALLRTTLAYSDEHKRLKVLVPIREYMQKIRPPGDITIHPMLKYFQQVLELYMAYAGNQNSPEVVARVTSSYSNIQNVIRNGLHPGHPDLVDSIYCACHLNSFTTASGRGKNTLIDQISDLLPRPCNPQLEVHFIAEFFNSIKYHGTSNADRLHLEALQHFDKFEDADLKCMYSHIFGSLEPH
ncbi:P-loop containing nucleoside triphosphate hydrolase protein [Mycena alexandri]|uniref:P-loop containing nucleoside triphosphate hydrolase protein n=1 Tax=Mycena alexandri TaxID=1745969 RepID=A0AAD6ST04_9AGAR|nr:P-loop containing nucleoside triphosphate hydrolase protein [Mycena alexandri]